MIKDISYVLSVWLTTLPLSLALTRVSQVNNIFHTTGVPDTKINPKGMGMRAMNIFSSLKVYAGKWSVKNRRAFSTEEVAAVDYAEVVPSQYGNSVCFFMKAGGQTFIPLSTESSLGVGDKVDLSKAELVTLQKQGEADIMRVEA